MDKWRARIFSVFMAVDTLLVGLVALPTLLRRDWAIALAKLWIRTLEWGLKVIAGIDRRVIGIELLPDGPAIIAAKHQSMWETLALAAVLPHPAFVLKQELKHMPVFGWWTTACGFIYVDRASGAPALKKMIADAERAISLGTSHIIIFPEGTRVRPGETGRYQPGVAALAKALNLPIVPVAHNSGSFWRHHENCMVPGTVTLQFGAPIDPALARSELMRQLESTIEPMTRALERDVASSPTNQSSEAPA